VKRFSSSFERVRAVCLSSPTRNVEGPEGDNWLFFSIANSRYAQASASAVLPPYFSQEEENEIDRRKGRKGICDLISVLPCMQSRKSREKTREQAATVGF
jgi:hypothetical protein